MLRGESNRPLEVLRDLVLAHVLGQVPDPQVPRLAHHSAVAARQARRRAVPPRLLTLASLRRAGEGATAAPPRGRRLGTSLQLDQSLSKVSLRRETIHFYISRPSFLARSPLRQVVRAKCARLLHLLSLLRFSLD